MNADKSDRSKLRIAFCTPGSLDYEHYKNENLLGTETQVLGFSEEFVRKGHDMYIFRPWRGDLAEEEIAGIHIVNIVSADLPDRFFQKTLSKIVFSKRVARQIQKIQPDVIVLTEICSAYFLTELPAKKIYVTHNPPSCTSPAQTRLANYEKNT